MSTTNHKFVSLILGLLFSCCVLAADEIAVNPAHPDRYVVVKGDTLWDIAARFLRDPWYWPDVWHVNPQIENPHLIYPGDILTMSFVDGRPRISMQRGSTVRLSPSIRSTPMDQAIPAIPVDAIRQFLTRPIVLDANTLDSAPYVVSFGEDHVVGGTDHLAYVRSIESQQDTRFEVVRPAEPLKDADTNEILGYNAQFVGNAELRRTGDPATVMLTSMELETLIGDRLLVVPDDISLTTFYPKAPDREIKGSIIKVLNGVSNIGQYDVVILDKGEQDGLARGDVLTVLHRGGVIRDTVTGSPNKRVVLPDEPAGKLMVFRTFPRVSFALIMHATRAIHVLDRVENP
jgi:hypothetical protein